MNQKPLDILMLFDIRETLDPLEEFIPDPHEDSWKSESSVLSTLKRMGHRVRSLSLYNDIGPLVDEVRAHPPALVFNLVEEFNAQSQLERNVAGLLELLGVPYTGCGSTGITLCKNKALAKKILTHHNIRTADFVVYERGTPFHLPHDLKFPLFVKPLREEASTGIAKSSFVETPEALAKRIHFIHETLEQDAMAEEYIHGRELYVSVIGHHRPEVLPVREMKFRDLPDDEPRFATYKAKWDPAYRKRWGINEGFADPLPAGVAENVERLCRKAYRVLQMDGYGRMDLRLTPENDIVFLEANPNPFLAPQEDFAESAKKAGYPFDMLLQRLLHLALHRPAA
jgi:D-alanine-D-alanine ligase